MGLLGIAGSMLGMIPKVGSAGGKKKGKGGGSKKGKNSKKSSNKKGSSKKNQPKSKKKKKKKKKKKSKLGKFFTKARKTYNKITKSDIVKKAKKSAKAAVLAVKNTCQKVKQKTKEVYNQAKQKTKEVYNQTKKKIKTTVKKSKQLMKEKVLSTKATRKTTGKSRVKAKDWTGHKNRINSEDELKALLDERRKTRVIGSDGEPIMTLMDKRKVVVLNQLPHRMVYPRMQ